MKISRRFAIEPDINRYVDETKGDRSASARANEMLRLAMVQERYGRLEAEAAEFFAHPQVDRAESNATQKAARPTLGRD